MTRSFYSLLIALGMSTAPCLCSNAGDAVSNLAPNPGFELGNALPDGWHGDDSQCERVQPGHESDHAISVHGDGKTSHAWLSDSIPLTPGGLYHLGFFARKTTNTSGGLIVSGIEGVNHDFGASDDWRPFGFTFSVPHNRNQSALRLGQWEVNGELLFDDVSLRPVQAVHEPYLGTASLGEGESVEGDVYRFHANFSWSGANYHRPLLVNHCGYNSDRWVFSNGSEVIYRHALPASQASASIRTAFNYYVAGTLRIEASRDGKAWIPVGTLDSKRREGTNALPSSLFPASEIYVRFSTTNSDANFQVNTYDYEASINGPVEDKSGKTHFLEVLQSSSQVAVALTRISGEEERDAESALDFFITNRSSAALAIDLTLKGDGLLAGASQKISLPANPDQGVAVRCAFKVEAPGKHEVTATVSDSHGGVLFEGRTEINVSLLADPRAGHWAGGSSELGLWWCESAWKIGRFKSWPEGTTLASLPIEIKAARGESEAVQLILHPKKGKATLSAVSLSDFVDKKGTTVSVTSRIEQVGYVHVTHPTDGTCQPGWYPDPLPPLELPLELPAGENCPLWITAQIARDAAPGDYVGRVQLETSAGKMSVPVTLHVYNFEIPRTPHLRTALGMGAGDVNRFHHLKKQEDQELVYQKYLTNFVEHRITPYSFFDYAGIDIRFEGEGTNKHARVDFERFDKAAEKWLDQEKLTSFLLPLKGMGGGTFQSRSLGVLEGFNEGTPEHARLFKDYLGQVEAHLKSRGWLDKAYAYWFDEPDQKDFEFVADGMKRIRAASPGLKRMLTKQPAPLLEGNVDIWCALTPEWTLEKVRARLDAGQEVWWYICCGPTAPYITEFIDHPGSELRLWPWQSWQYGVQGLLIWSTTYWTSDCAYPGGAAQNPWKDPMSYVSGYDFQPGYKGYWGNGDGRFLYPPRTAFNQETPCLDAPINSIRWENLRDGMEDYEYFWLLNQAIQQAVAHKTHKDLIEAARSLLTVPKSISTDTTHFTTDAQLLSSHRERVAGMIEQLQVP